MFAYQIGFLPRALLTGGATLLSLLACVAPCARAAEPLPLLGLAGVTLQTADLDGPRDFYARRAGFVPLVDGPDELRLAVGNAQWLAFVPGLPWDYVRRVHSVTLTTSDTKALEKALRARRVAVTKAKTGAGLKVRDPAGNVLMFEPVVARTDAATETTFSRHLQHVGLIVPREHEAESIAFYRDTLGLQEAFRMDGPADKDGQRAPSLIKYRLPGERGDIVELIFTGGDLNKWAAGSIAHVNFAVDDIEATYCHLVEAGIATRDHHRPKVNAERLWAIDIIDPELTRVEIQVLAHAKEEIGTLKNPACSEPGERVRGLGGYDLDDWSGEDRFWRRQKAGDAHLVGLARHAQNYDAFLWHQRLVLRDFYLSVWVRQFAARDRSGGIQFRSQRTTNDRAAGYRLILGGPRAGQLTRWPDDTGSKTFAPVHASLEKTPVPGTWTHYELLAVGHEIWTAVNGQIVSRVNDASGELTGLFALVLPGGGPQEIRFRDIEIVRNPPLQLAGQDEDALRRLLVANGPRE